MYSNLLILAVCLCASVAQNSQIQGKSTEERNSNEVPNSETDNIQTNDGHRSKREAPRLVKFKINGETFQLSLSPAEHNALPYCTPVWTVEYTFGGPHHAFKLINETVHKLHETTLYHDSEKMGTLLAYYKGDRIVYDGVFGESKLTKTVRSLPERLWTKADDSNKYNIVYNVGNTHGTTQPISGRPLNDLQRMSAIFGISNINPKILVIVENTYFRKFGRNIAKIMRYLETFWNSVNLQFSKIIHPKVKITITGVIIAEDDSALMYIRNAREETNMKKINYEKLLNNSINYFRNEFINYLYFNDYDLTMNMINLDSGELKGTVSNVICSPEGTSGFVWDDGRYFGVLHALRALGSSLGMPFDDVGECDNSPESNSRSIMAKTICPVEKYYWSEESQMALFSYSMDEAAKCLKEQVEGLNNTTNTFE